MISTDLPTCAKCGRPFSAQEARAGYDTCEHCLPDPEPEEELDVSSLPWEYEEGEDTDGEAGQVIVYPYRTIFARCSDDPADVIPLADLAEDADEEIGMLMAAAPDLLGALEESITMFGGLEGAGDPTHPCNVWRRRARAAVAKARGEGDAE